MGAVSAHGAHSTPTALITWRTSSTHMALACHSCIAMEAVRMLIRTIGVLHMLPAEYQPRPIRRILCETSHAVEQTVQQATPGQGSQYGIRETLDTF